MSHSSIKWFLAVTSCATTLAVLWGCDDDDDGRGAYWSTLGDACASDRDCDTGYCCRTPECGGGTCTFACRDDLDCPRGTLCENKACFFTCVTDRDCAVRQTCKHARTVCQY